jgi:hypothetical protein
MATEHRAADIPARTPANPNRATSPRAVPLAAAIRRALLGDWRSMHERIEDEIEGKR